MSWDTNGPPTGRLAIRGLVTQPRPIRITTRRTGLPSRGTMRADGLDDVLPLRRAEAADPRGDLPRLLGDQAGARSRRGRAGRRRHPQAAAPDPAAAARPAPRPARRGRATLTAAGPPAARPRAPRRSLARAARSAARRSP